MFIGSLFNIRQYFHKDNETRVVFTLNDQHPIFAGHFPEQPILPGVCQVQLIHECVEKQLEQKLMMHAAANIKFMNMIIPSPDKAWELVLMITPNEQEWKVKATITDSDTIFLKFQGRFQQKMSK